MITCREDLHNTWVDVTKDHEVVRLFAAIYDKGALFGDEIMKPYDEVNGKDCVAISIDSRGGWAKHTDKPFHPTLREVTMSDFIPSNDVKYYDKDEEIKPQDGLVSNAIKDFKLSQERTNQKWERFQDCYVKVKGELMSDNKAPRAKTEYVRVTDSIFDIKDELNNGELYHYSHTCGGDDFYLPIESEDKLVFIIHRNSVYRKVSQIGLQPILKDAQSVVINDKLIGVTPMHHCDFVTMCRLVVESVDKK